MSGSRVTSVRKAWSSTVPISRTDGWLETGKSGLVISVGFVKAGIARSTRSVGRTATLEHPRAVKAEGSVAGDPSL